MTSARTTIDQLVRQAAADRGDHEALIDAPNRADFFHGEPLRLTWTEVDHAVTNLATQLAGMGVGVDTRVGIQLPNAAELALTILVCARLRAVAVPFPIQHRTHEIRHGTETAGITHFVTAARADRPDHVDLLREIAAEVGGIQIALFGDAGGLPQLSVDARGAPALPDESGPDDVVSVCWTSGTTGTPKGVPRTNAMWLATGYTQADQLGLSPADRMLCPFPVVNMAGIGGMLLPWVITGSTLVMHQPLDLPVFLGQIEGEAITYTVSPPPLLNMLIRNEALLASTDWSSVRAICSGSAPLDAWMIEGWEARGIEIINAFGSNEGSALLSNRSGVPDPSSRARFFPRPDPAVLDVRLIDLDTGDEITDAGRMGELRYRGSTVFEGYLDSDGDEFDSDGWFRSGDLFEWVEQHEGAPLMRFVDRAKDIIIRGGMNVSAAEVEALIAAHPAVAECAVVAYPDRDLGERVGVFVVAAPDASPSLDDVVAQMREADVASYKIPERLEVVEALPRNPVGKVVKPDLRARWADAG
ncbi:MAG: AMP-binding protein [Acidimicrobiales bacterium]